MRSLFFSEPEKEKSRKEKLNAFNSARFTRPSLPSFSETAVFLKFSLKKRALLIAVKLQIKGINARNEL